MMLIYGKNFDLKGFMIKLEGQGIDYLKKGDNFKKL